VGLLLGLLLGLLGAVGFLFGGDGSRAEGDAVMNASNRVKRNTAAATHNLSPPQPHHPGLIYYDLDESIGSLRSRLNVLFLQ